MAERSAHCHQAIAEIRVRNLSYAITRVSALAGTLLVLGSFSWLAWITDAVWYMVAAALGFALIFVVWAFYCAAKAAWWLEFGQDGLRVRYLFGERQYGWPDVIRARLRHETTYVYKRSIEIPLVHHPVLEFLTLEGRRIVVCLNRDELQGMRAIEGFEAGADGWVPLEDSIGDG